MQTATTTATTSASSFPQPQNTLTLYFLQSDTVNSATDVEFGPQMSCIASNLQEACDYFFDSHPWYVEEWEEWEKGEGRPGDYAALSKEEKQQVHRDWFSHPLSSVEIHSFPLIYLEGLNHLLDPFQQENARLQREMQIETLRHTLSHPKSSLPAVPPEVLDMHINPRLK
jgi:hypothetical protein